MYHLQAFANGRWQTLYRCRDLDEAVLALSRRQAYYPFPELYRLAERLSRRPLVPVLLLAPPLEDILAFPAL